MFCYIKLDIVMSETVKETYTLAITQLLRFSRVASSPENGT